MVVITAAVWQDMLKKGELVQNCNKCVLVNVAMSNHQT